MFLKITNSFWTARFQLTFHQIQLLFRKFLRTPFTHQSQEPICYYYNPQLRCKFTFSAVVSQWAMNSTSIISQRPNQKTPRIAFIIWNKNTNRTFPFTDTIKVTAHNVVHDTRNFLSAIASPIEKFHTGRMCSLIYSAEPHHVHTFACKIVILHVGRTSCREAGFPSAKV